MDADCIQNKIVPLLRNIAKSDYNLCAKCVHRVGRKRKRLWIFWKSLFKGAYDNIMVKTIVQFKSYSFV